MYNLVDSFYTGEKNFVLDIGAMSCSLINQFLINGYTQLTAIDKLPMSIYSCFLNYKIAKKEITKIDQTYILHDKGNETININKIDNIIATLYALDLNEYYDSVNLCSGNRGNFFTFQPIEKFNIILSSFIFHFYPPEADIDIINKLKGLANKNGIIYIKVHNIERLNSKGLQFERDGLTLKKDGYTWYLFDNARSNLYKNNFEIIFETSSGNRTELLLINK